MSLTSLTTGISDYATRRAIQQLASKLNYDASPTFAGLTISGEALSSTLITQWSTAYSWGDHAGLYDTIGAASGEIDDHEATYDHSLLHSPVTLGTANGLTLNDQELSLPTTATPTLAGLTLTGMSGVVKTTAGVFSGSATLDDMADGTNYARVAATELSSGVYKNATTTVKGIASFSSTNFSVTDGAVSLATGGGLTHNDLGSLQGGTTGEYYHFTSADYAKIANWDTAYGWGDHSAGGYFVKASDDLDDVTAGTTNVHLTTTLKTSYDGAASHKTTEDAINGLVSCNGTGTYSAKAIGTDVQAYSSLLAAIAALTPTDSNIIVGDGSTWVAESGATARTSLGLGAGDSPTFTNLTLSTTSSVNVPLFACADASANYTPWFRNDGRSVELTIDSFRDATSGSFIAMRHARGSVASPAILQDGDEIASFFSRGYDGVSAWRNAAGLIFIVDENPTLGYSPPTSIRFYVSNGTTTSWQWAGAFQYDGKFGVGTLAPQEGIHCTTKIRSNVAFNLNGTDGVTQASSAGKVCDVTALAGGIATAQTQITYAADGTYNFDATSGKVSSITITNGRITAITTAA